MDKTPKQIQVGLVQISESRYGNKYLPYSVGLLQAYAQKYLKAPEKFHFLPFVYDRILVSEAVEQLQSADIVGFSTYIWNINRSLAIAEALKTHNPEVLIVFGGPQKPDDSEPFLRQYPFVDLCCHGEGEMVFTALLEAFPKNDWQDIPGISYLDPQGNYHNQPKAPRIQDLNQIPSPYLTGVFDEIMAAHPKQRWIGTWETNRGCPFFCSYCDWGAAIQSKVYRFDLERIQAEIDWFGQKKLVSLFSSDANFGILKRDIEIANYLAKAKHKYGFPLEVQTQTAKNVTQRIYQVQKIMADAGLATVTAISLQTLNPAALKAIKRDNISIQTYTDLQSYCIEHKIYNYTDMILALPEETYDSFADGISEVIRMGQHNRILYHNASVLPNAEMGDPAYQAQYGIETLKIHFPGHATMADKIHEYLEIIVATRTLSREDWIRMHTFAWTNNFLYFSNKLMQVVFLIVNQVTGISFRDLTELFMTRQRLQAYPILFAIHDMFENTARLLLQSYANQADNPWLFSLTDGVHLSPEFTMQLKLCEDNQLAAFYEQAFGLLQEYLQLLAPHFPEELLIESFWVNRVVFSQLYYKKPQAHNKIAVPYPEQLHLHWNIPEVYRGLITNKPIPLKNEPTLFVCNPLHPLAS